MKRFVLTSFDRDTRAREVVSQFLVILIAFLVTDIVIKSGSDNSIIYFYYYLGRCHGYRSVLRTGVDTVKHYTS